MMAYVTTTLRQEIEVPEGTTKQEIYDFLAEHQSFRDAFCGISDGDVKFMITNISVVEDELTELGEETYCD
jgi:hypothetical protein